MSLPKFKIITQNGRVFLIRLSFAVPNGSIKFHLILNDDEGEPHIHPWEFTSFMLLGAYRELVNGKVHNHRPLSLVRNNRHKEHKVMLYRLFGLKLPCLTVGKYTDKIQPWCRTKALCDRCRSFGYCLDKEYWENRTKPSNS